MWAWVKRVFAVVDAIYTIVDVVALLGIIFLPFNITTSDTLRGFIAGFGILGGVLGYFLTVTAWAGRGKTKSLQRRNTYLFIFWFPVILFLGTLVALRPDVAIKYPSVRPIREFLLTAMPLANFMIGIGAGVASFFLVGAITLSSPKLAQTGIRHG